MSIISFIKEAGEKLFGHKETEAAAAAPDDAALQAKAIDANATAATAIAGYISAQGLSVDGLDVAFDGATGTVSVAGSRRPGHAREGAAVLRQRARREPGR